ncbi:MAG: transposase domain-containing protein, partial [Deltaproteobacteria bacterium]|nr:transposase domain-containing protein [Deltaproteobacteria bacterium]
CQLNGINPETYMADVLVRLRAGCDVEALMPWNWAPAATA